MRMKTVSALIRFFFFDVLFQKMLSKNYEILTKNFRSTGSHVHTAQNDGYMNITIQRCLDETDFIQVDNHTNTNAEDHVHVRVNVGKNDAGLYYKFPVSQDTFVIPNIPIYQSDEAWIAISVVNKYCVIGHASKSPSK